jgi:hypothetical protein
MSKIPFVNNDTTTPVVGDIVRSSGQNFGAVLALADTTAHAEGLIGVWATTPGPGYSGDVCTDSIVEVNCTETVLPGDRLYISATTAGKATKVAPAIPVAIGTVVATRTVNGVCLATLPIGSGSSESSTSVAATGSLTTIAVASYTDGDYFTLGDGTHAVVKIEPRAKALGSITFLDKVSISDNETLVIDDGTHTITFEAQVTEDFETVGSTTVVDLTGATDAQSVAVLYRAAINGIVAGLTVTAALPVAGVMSLTNDATGSIGNVTITGTAGFTKTGMSRGLGGDTPVVGGTVVDLTGLTSATEGAVAIADGLNALGASTLNLTATSSSGVVSLINNTVGAAGNVTITENVSNAGFSVSGMSGGRDDVQGLITTAGATASNALGTASVTGTTGTAGGKVVLDVGATISVNKLTIASAAVTSGVFTAFTHTAAAHTGLTATTEVPDVLFNLAATKTWAAGALTTQRDFVIKARTYAFASASVVSDGATLAIEGPPIAGGNATITRPKAFWVQSGISRFDGVTIFSLGSAAAPAIADQADPTKGFFFAGTTTTGSIGFSINGVVQATLTTTGLGVGVTAPGSAVDARSAIATGGAVGNLQLIDTTTQSAGHGGAILFGGAYTGTTVTTGAAIRCSKTNSTGGEFGFGLQFYTRPNGGSATLNLVITDGGNVVLGTGGVAGATAAKCLVLTNAATAPAASADLCHLYAADIAAGRATLATYCEEAVAADVALASTHSLIEFINGAKYKRMLVAVA